VSVNPTGPGGTPSPGTANNWLVTSTQRTPWVTSPSNVVDAVRVGFQTVPHGVEAFVMVPYTTFWVEGPDLIVQPVAFGIETILDIPAADDAWYIDDLDAANLQQGFIEYLVSVPSPSAAQPGPFTDTVVVPIGRVADYTYVQGLLQAAQAKLAAVVAGG